MPTKPLVFLYPLFFWFAVTSPPHRINPSCPITPVHSSAEHLQNAFICPVLICCEYSGNEKIDRFEIFAVECLRFCNMYSLLHSSRTKKTKKLIYNMINSLFFALRPYLIFFLCVCVRNHIIYEKSRYLLLKWWSELLTFLIKYYTNVLILTIYLTDKFYV